MEDLAKEIRELQIQNEKLRRELWKNKRRPTAIVGYGLVLLGGIALVSSIFFTSNIPLFIGVALVFWGALLLFVRPVRYVKASLIDSISSSSCFAIDKIISELNLEGKGIYLPPKRLKSLKSGTIFIPRQSNNMNLPSETLIEEKVFLNPLGICLPPLGLGLVNLFEKEIGTDFTKVDLNYLQKSLPKLFVESLEIAQDFQISMEKNNVFIKMTNSIFSDVCRETRRLSNICSSIGCPICSSIACALARASWKPVIIEKNHFDESRNILQAQYRIIEE